MYRRNWWFCRSLPSCYANSDIVKHHYKDNTKTLKLTTHKDNNDEYSIPNSKYIAPIISQGNNKRKAPLNPALAWLTAAMIAFESLTASASDKEESPSAHARAIKIDSSVVTEHETKILGQRVKYSATTGTQPVWNSKDEAVATLFYTYYQRTDIKENTKRPLIISFNGGPPASVDACSYTGPRILNIDDEVIRFSHMAFKPILTLF